VASPLASCLSFHQQCMVIVSCNHYIWAGCCMGHKWRWKSCNKFLSQQGFDPLTSRFAIRHTNQYDKNKYRNTAAHIFAIQPETNKLGIPKNVNESDHNIATKRTSLRKMVPVSRNMWQWNVSKVLMFSVSHLRVMSPRRSHIDDNEGKVHLWLHLLTVLKCTYYLDL